MVEKKRHLAKAISYRVLGSLFNGILALLLTHSYSISITFFLVDFWAKVLFYYVHERLWYRIKWGVKTE